MSFKKFLISLMCLSFAIPQFAFAAGGLSSGLGKLNTVATQAYGSTPQSDLQVIVGRIIKGFLQLLGVVFIVLMVYAGYLWMTAQGEAEKVNQAKKLIVQAVIGLAIILAAYAIAAFVIARLQASTIA